MLALFGGAPTRTEKLAPWPFYDQDEIEAAKNTLVSGKVNYWTGNITREFENEFARYHNMKYGIALANGTNALELALYGLNIGPGDEVITTCKTFIASASCIVQRGAIPVIADIEEGSQNISAATIAPLITAKTKAVILVHLGGMPCEMPAISDLCKKHRIFLIEDCAQAHGAKINGQLIGSFGDVAAFSFCQDKIISTAGEGGMLLLNDENLYKKMWAFKDHGKNYDLAHQKGHGFEFRYIHESFGTNWRLTEFQSAVGMLQLKKLESWVQKRREISHAIMEGLQGVRGISFYTPPANYYHAYYRLYAFIDIPSLSTDWNKTKIIEAINAEGIPCMTGSCSEIYLEKAFTQSPFAVTKRLPVAEKLTQVSVAFLVHPTLDAQYASQVVSAVKKVMTEATQNPLKKKSDLTTSKVKILRVATVPSAFVHIESQVQYFKNTPFDMSMASSPTEDYSLWSQRLQSHIEPIDIPREISLGKDLRALWALTRYLQKEDFKIVHSSTPKAGLIVAMAAFLARVPVRLHTFTGQRWATLHGPKRWLLKALDRLVIKLNTQCFADSQSQIDFLVAEGVAQKNEIQCIGSGSFGGVNTQKFSHKKIEDRSRVEILEKIPASPLRFVYIGRMVADKGLNEALAAFDQLSQKYKDIQFWLVGPMEGENDPISEVSKKIIKDNSQVYFLGPKNNPQEYLKASDALLIPSYREGFGTVAIEAAACALPTIGTKIPGLVDSVVHTQTGLLVNPRSVPELMQVMESVIQNPQKLHEMGEKAYTRCLQEFSAEHISALTESKYRELLSERKMIHG